MATIKFLEMSDSHLWLLEGRKKIRKQRSQLLSQKTIDQIYIKEKLGIGCEHLLLEDIKVEEFLSDDYLIECDHIGKVLSKV